jgi:hypothetical protein
MKKIKNILLGMMVIFSTTSFSEVAEVYQWKAFPGKSQDMLVSMGKAAAIHASEGAQVSINAHNIGSTQLVDYVVRWDNAKEYAKSKDVQRNSEAWVEFWAESNQNPSGELVASFAGNNLDQSKKASDFDGSYVYSVSVWKVVPGKDMSLIERFMESKSILEDTGARVEVYAGNWGAPGEYHYVLLYDSWTDLEASFAQLNAPGSDWLKMMQRRANDEIVGEQIGFFTGSTLN